MSKLLTLLAIFASSCASHQHRGPASWHSCYEDLNAIVFRPGGAHALDSAPFHQSQTLADLRQAYGEESFFDIHMQMSNEDIVKNNDNLLRLLNEEPFLESDAVNRLSKPQAKKLYDEMNNTPCVSNDSPYQRPGVAIGYCFGRAIVSHMHALRRGIDPRAMKKIWVVGPMRGDWGHHVAYMVRAKNGSWWVVDNVTGLVSHKEWIRQLKTFKYTDKELMFFVSEAARFGPRKNYSYNTVNLFNIQGNQFSGFDREADYYRGFFRDLFEYLDETPQPEAFTPSY